jgi:hypothetical protein
MTPSEITSITNLLAWKTGIIFCLLYSIISYYGRKKVLKRIEESLQKDENIAFKFPFRFEIFFLPLVVGGFWGGFILPFFIYSEIQYIEPFDRSFLPLLIILEVILIGLILYTACWKLIVTNQRIIGAYAFQFMDNINNKFIKLISGKPFESINIKFSDINYIERSGNLFKIGLKDSTFIRAVAYSEKVKSYINNHLNSENI